MNEVKEVTGIQELIKLMRQLKDNERLSVDIQIVTAKKKEKNHE